MVEKPGHKKPRSLDKAMADDAAIKREWLRQTRDDEV